MGGAALMYSMSKYFGDRQRETIDRRLKRMRERAYDPRIQLVDRVNQLEDDLGRVLLLVQALAETCIAKGVLDRKEIAQMAKKVDLADGVADGKLDPQTVRPAQPKPPPPAATPEEHLRKLEEEG
ncbi:MAG: hypothetical protein HQ581_23045 [Planctomycetes bacterium]|nr:hypothetical protein [Planctomycetota bacterium]